MRSEKSHQDLFVLWSAAGAAKAQLPEQCSFHVFAKKEIMFRKKFRSLSLNRRRRSRELLLLLLRYFPFSWQRFAYGRKNERKKERKKDRANDNIIWQQLFPTLNFQTTRILHRRLLFSLLDREGQKKQICFFFVIFSPPPVVSYSS